MGYRRMFVSVAVCFILLTGSAGLSSAENFNIDFGYAYGITSNLYGAASGQTGNWISPNLTYTAGLRDINLNLTGVSSTITLTNGTHGWFTECAGAVHSLIDDYFYADAWNIVIAGLTNGFYTIYIYGPSNNYIPTGDMLVNGIPIASVISAPGDECAMVRGAAYASVVVKITKGHLSMSGSGTTSLYLGLSGIQIKMGSCDNATVKRGTGYTGTIHPTIQEAYDLWLSAMTIRAQDTFYCEDIYFDEDKSVLLAGGYNSGSFFYQTGYTTVSGSITISGGPVTVENIIIL